MNLKDRFPELIYEGAFERFSQPFELQELDSEKNTFAGMATIFGSCIEPVPPYYMFTFYMPGSFDQSIKTNFGRVKIKYMHDETIGLPTELRETDREPYGLWVRGKISLTSIGADVMLLLKDKVLTEMSMGSMPDYKSLIIMSGAELLKWLDDQASLAPAIKKMMRAGIEERGEDTEYRVVTKAKLFEVSIVDWGADPNTFIAEAARRSTKFLESLVGKKLSGANTEEIKKARKAARQIYKQLSALLKKTSVPADDANVDDDQQAKPKDEVEPQKDIVFVKPETTPGLPVVPVEAVNLYRSRLRDIQKDAARAKFQIFTKEVRSHV